MSAPINAITVYPEIENYEINAPKKTCKGKSITAEQSLKRAIAFIKKIVSVCPEFGACLSLFVGKNGLTFEHGKFSFSINPRFLGLDPVCLRMGQIINLSRTWIEKPKEQTYKHAKKAIKSDSIIKYGQGLWTDGTMLFVGNAPNGFKKEEFTAFGDYVRPLIEKFNGDNFTRYCTDSINIFQDKELDKMVKIGNQFYDLHKINFAVKNTSSKKSTCFLVHNEGFLAVEKNSDIVGIVSQLNKNKIDDEQLIPCGKWECKGLSTRPEIDTPLRVAIGLEKEEQPEHEKELNEQLVQEEQQQHEPLPEVSEASEPTEPFRQEKHIEHKDVSVGDTVYFSDITDENKRIPANFRGFNGDGTATVIWNGQNMSLPVDRIFRHDIEHKQEEKPEHKHVEVVEPSEPLILQEPTELPEPIKWIYFTKCVWFKPDLCQNIRREPYTLPLVDYASIAGKNIIVGGCDISGYFRDGPYMPLEEIKGSVNTWRPQLPFVNTS